MKDCGLVYIMGNLAMPNYLKVGMTERSPYKRAEELSSSTSVPLAFNVLAYAFVESPREVEAELHLAMGHMRVSSNREFFEGRLSEIASYFDEECDLVLTRRGAFIFAAELAISKTNGEKCTEEQYRTSGKVTRVDWRDIRDTWKEKDGVDLDAFISSFFEANLRLVGADNA